MHKPLKLMGVNNSQIYNYKLVTEDFYRAGPHFKDIISVFSTPVHLIPGHIISLEQKRKELKTLEIWRS